MTENEFGLKELYSVKIKATYPIEIGNKHIDEGETIIYLDSVQLSGFQENVEWKTANGGKGNPVHVQWETTRQVNFYLDRGIFSKTHLALLVNSKLAEEVKGQIITVPMREQVETDEQGKFKPNYAPLGNFYVYDLETGNRITNYTVSEGIYQINNPYKELILDYNFGYDKGGSLITVGARLVKGFLRLEGRTKVKDDVTGQTHTGIIIIPKFKLMSNLSMSLGENANPVVGRLEAIAYTDEQNIGDRRVVEMYFLNDDIDSDM